MDVPIRITLRAQRSADDAALAGAKPGQGPRRCSNALRDPEIALPTAGAVSSLTLLGGLLPTLQSLRMNQSLMLREG